jgi:hypothetical protein
MTKVVGSTIAEALRQRKEEHVDGDLIDIVESYGMGKEEVKEEVKEEEV